MVQSQKKPKLRNVRVHSITPLDSPAEYWRKYPSNEKIERQVADHREQIACVNFTVPVDIAKWNHRNGVRQLRHTHHEPFLSRVRLVR